ncbi:MAG: UbiA family prenyltransferase [Chloroflexota bacterium]|nr:UbiA family prenyltransferase [Chloroflexota bacterium]
MSSYETKLSYRPPWQQTLYGYLALARVSNSPTVVSNVLAGAALAGVTVPLGTVALLAIALVLFYTAGMYLNDLCDYAMDCRERPDRPLPSGTVSRSGAIVGVFALFAVGSALLWYVGSAAFLSGLVLIGLIVVYDAWHKTNPLSPLVMAGTRLMVYVTAFVSFSSNISSALMIWASLLALYIIGLTYMAKTESGPQLTKYWPAVLLFLPAIYVLIQTPTVSLLPLLLLFVAWVAYSVSFVYDRRKRSIGGAIGRLIAGISLLDSLVLAVAATLPSVIVALLAFGLTLFFQRYIRGT